MDLSGWGPIRRGRALWEQVQRIRAVDLVRAVGHRSGENNGGQMAAALTYYAFLSLFPLLLLALSVIGYLLKDDPTAQREWVNRLAGSVPGLGSIIASNMRAVVEGRATAGAIGLAGLLWAGMGMVGGARTTLARIFRLPRASNPVLKRFRTVGALAALGVVALGSVSVTGFLAGLGSEAGVGLAVRALGIAGAAAVDLGFFLLAYRVLAPGSGPSYPYLVPGALLMAAGWTGLKLAGAWYAARVISRASAIYGTFAAVIGVLAIFNIAAQLFVYGAELCAVMSERRHERTGVL
ncbi:MAG TPA: YihY/virulence factor BrkB family protein [Actinomycetota bacterium]|nr:YihY/virulence factor BrkB family protein [Actinomycetota bacterium]